MRTTKNLLLFEELVRRIIVNTEQKAEASFFFKTPFPSQVKAVTPSDVDVQFLTAEGSAPLLVAFSHISCETLLQQIHALSLKLQLQALARKFTPH